MTSLGYLTIVSLGLDGHLKGATINRTFLRMVSAALPQPRLREGSQVAPWFALLPILFLFLLLLLQH